MAYLGEVKIAEIAPDHPFATSQIVFGVKRPNSAGSQAPTPNESTQPDTRSANPVIETEEDGIKAEALRRLKVRKLLGLAKVPNDE